MRKFTDINEGFVCSHCGKHVQPSAKSCRNHCPQCLYSVHLDDNPGDRSADCGGLMKPVAVLYNPKKGYQVVHRCLVCGTEKRNVLDFEDELQPDSMDTALAIMKNG
ncbi:RNHCP domain-containing protein [Alicyclobacillus sp. SO9]|uniref:RNHCP domain-containing protein n=1 Tax=Alicyclobacillus sp. SO9 TaxID=2665646 RepID=UPI0018E860D3|nr:RNHCP domain-containing protein [Alicyclobacillus sp. SO9]QQE76919.1 RNHCP domain-containing protein [Alicyclobacillus sp. SO9]